ncbi:MAG: hypothetical protein HY646_09725 [Acidobacteria bacterium]|nr:hypothetical protein [Acidobacteriota bacterium]
MLRRLERENVHLGLSADALAGFYPVKNYDDFIRWFQGIKPLEGDLETFRPLLAFHIERLKAENIFYAEIMIALDSGPDVEWRFVQVLCDLVFR